MSATDSAENKNGQASAENRGEAGEQTEHELRSGQELLGAGAVAASGMEVPSVKGLSVSEQLDQASTVARLANAAAIANRERRAAAEDPGVAQARRDAAAERVRAARGRKSAAEKLAETLKGFSGKERGQ